MQNSLSNGEGYGDALIFGINSVETELFCIFNADGSFDPKELSKMTEQMNNTKADFILELDMKKTVVVMTTL